MYYCFSEEFFLSHITCNVSISCRLLEKNPYDIYFNLKDLVHNYINEICCNANLLNELIPLELGMAAICCSRPRW